jgi:hypothetical protein
VRGYTTVVPVDTTAAATDYETAIGFYQILNQNPANLRNELLEAEIRNAQSHGHDHLPISDWRASGL